MRKLNGRDLMAGVRLVKAAGMKEQINRVARLAQNDSNLTALNVGYEFLYAMIENLGDAEQLLWEFLAGPLEMSPDELANCDILAIEQKVEELIENEDKESWNAFFSRLARLMK